MSEKRSEPKPIELQRGVNGELIWDEKFAETMVTLSNDGEKLLADFGIDPGSIVQSMAIEGGRRIGSGKRVDDPKFIATIGQVEYPEDFDRAQELIDLLTDLFRGGELNVRHYGRPR